MLSKSLENSLNQVFQQAKDRRYEYLTLEQLLLVLLDNPETSVALKFCGADLSRLRFELASFITSSTPLIPSVDKEFEPQPTPAFQRVLQRAIFQVQTGAQGEVHGINVLVAIFGEQDSQACYFLKRENISRLALINYLHHGMVKSETVGTTDLSPLSKQWTEEEASTHEGVSSQPLENYAVNLNAKAKAGNIDPLIGRQDELMRMVQVLCRRHKNNPLLVGEAGVGKTAIVEGLAQAIVEKRVPTLLQDSTIYALDLGGLLAGTKYRGDFEKRFKALIAQLKQEKGAILFVDEIHTLIGAGAASGGIMDAANLIKPLLSHSEITCVGATTYREYRSIFEKDHALARRFQKIDITEPNDETAIQMVLGLASRLEMHHGVKYSHEALRASVTLSSRYLIDRYLPDKAIDVLDEAGAFQALQPASKRKKLIHVPEVESIIAKMAQIPPRSVSVRDKTRLKSLERDLKMQVFGQEQAIEVLASSIKLSRAGLRETQKPIGAFLLAGPTGVGKTELAKQLARFLSVDFLRFDMSEYMERHTVSRLIGAPPGYVGFDQGGLLTEAISKHPHAVLLLDEIEKAHPDVFNLLLQVMDHGALTDTNGRKVDFRHIVLLMTTNAGAEELDKPIIGFQSERGEDDNLQAIKKLFSPEFRNRLDAIIPFHYLDSGIVAQVVDKFILELESQLEEKHVHFDMTPEARAWLAEHGYDRSMGARPMARLIQERIKRPLAEELLFGKLLKGGCVHLTVANDELFLKVDEKMAAEA